MSDDIRELTLSRPTPWERPHLEMGGTELMIEGRLQVIAEPDVDVVWFSDFVPAISGNPAFEAGCVSREPAWFALRYVAGKERLLLRLLRVIGLPFQYLTFQQRVKRRKPIDRPWIPGYLFVEMDVRRDLWQQVNRMPHVLGFLGSPSPIPLESVEDLIGRCPSRLPKASALSAVAPGTTVEILRGPFAGFKQVVTWSDRKYVKVAMMIFGRPSADVTLKVNDVRVVVAKKV